MTATPKIPASAAPSKVQAIRPVVKAVEPPEGWKLQSEFGFMRLDDSPAGALVRLADVMHWLETSRSVPRVTALEVLCAAMSPDVMQWLYWVQPGDYAKPVPADHMWGYQTVAQIDAQKAQNRQNALQRNHEDEQTNREAFRGFQSFTAQSGKVASTPIVLTEPGLPALLKLIHEHWSKAKFNRASTVDILDDPRVTNLSTLAIRIDKAFELWGGGYLPDSAVEPLGSVAEGWTGEKLAAQQRVFKADGHRDFAKRTWELAGVKERDGRRLVSEYEATKKPKALVSSVFDMGKAAAKKTRKQA